MKILFSNIWLANYAGTELYVRDLAIEFQRRGIHVEVYSPELGNVAEEIRNAGIHICDHPEELHEHPDIIHGHHFRPTMMVLEQFRSSPAIYVLHDKTYWGDTPPHSKRIIHYVAVDIICKEKLLKFGIKERNITTMLNWVDIKRFYQRKKISNKPSKALVFSNNANPDNYYKIVAAACQKMNLPADAIGNGFNNNIKNPQDVIGNYDIIFAKGKAAIESLASGAGLIVCDFRGLGGMVLPENYDFFRNNNFGMNSMIYPHEVDLIVQEIEKYNAEKIKRVSDRIRSEADFKRYVDNIITLYHKVIRTYRWKRYFISRKQDDRILRTFEQTRKSLK